MSEQEKNGIHSIHDVPKGQEGLDWILEHREEFFPWTKQEIYLNNAAYAPGSIFANNAARAYREGHAEHGSQFVQIAKAIREQTRAAIAKLLGCKASEIGFVPNTTTGINLVAQGMDWKTSDEVLVLDEMHEYSSNFMPWEAASMEGKVRMVKMKGDENGFIDSEEICAKLTTQTRLVTISSVGFKTGQRVDLESIGNIIHKHNEKESKKNPNRKPTRFHVDAVQQMGASKIDVKNCHIDFLTAGGQKWMLADNGIGVLFATRETVKDLIHRQTGAYAIKEWANPRSGFKEDIDTVEVGTNNESGIWALGAAAELINRIGIDNIEERILALTARLREGLEKKGYAIFSPRTQKEKPSGIVMASKTEWELKLAKVQTLAGVTELGEKFEKEMAGVKNAEGKKPIVFSVRGGRMRISVHYYNTKEEIDEFVDRLPEIPKQIRNDNHNLL